MPPIPSLVPAAPAVPVPCATPPMPGAHWYAAEAAAGAGAGLWLLPERAAFDPVLGLLLVADAHLGKAHVFRRLGVPVPAGTTERLLARLDAVLTATGARELVFLGDLLHGPAVQRSAALQAFCAWRATHPQVTMTLLRGNHDARAGDPPPEAGLQLADAPLRRGPWRLLHEPEAPSAPPPAPPPALPPPATADRALRAETGYALAGHLHPGLSLGVRRGDRLRLPCFHFGPAAGVLPAFGEFTGLHLLRAGPGERQYAVLPPPQAAVRPVQTSMVRVPAPR
ncbi:MAG: hypothetical protein RLY78_404 [Pseudomonadota bacterium]